MSRRKCGRCNWTAESDDRTELEAAAAAHVAETGHKRCASCPRFLTDTEAGACLDCIARAREALAEIVTHYALLAVIVGKQHGAPTLEAIGRGSDETTLPGGDALVMLAGGGEGNDRDSRVGDPESAAQTLGQWEDAVRHARHLTAADTLANVTSAAGYLSPLLTWVAAEMDVFDLLFTDLRRLRSRLLRLTWLDQPVLRAPVECFDCGEERLEKQMTSTGLTDNWRCTNRRCQREYSNEAYHLALTAKLAATQEARRLGA